MYFNVTFTCERFNSFTASMSALKSDARRGVPGVTFGITAGAGADAAATAAPADTNDLNHERRDIGNLGLLLFRE